MSGSNKMSDSDWEESEQEINGVKYNVYRMGVTKVSYSTFDKMDSTEVSDYQGRTFCYSVPSGMLVVKRNGKVAVCGNTAPSFMEKNPGMTFEEADAFLRDFENALPYIFGGQKRDIRKIRKTGVVYTWFGRPRRVKYWMQHPEKKKRAFGIRTIKNTQIQGAAGDLLRLMVIRLYNAVFAIGVSR